MKYKLDVNSILWKGGCGGGCGVVVVRRLVLCPPAKDENLADDRNSLFQG